jgi:hypothetical protein
MSAKSAAVSDSASPRLLQPCNARGLRRKGAGRLNGSCVARCAAPRWTRIPRGGPYPIKLIEKCFSFLEIAPQRKKNIKRKSEAYVDPLFNFAAIFKDTCL